MFVAVISGKIVKDSDDQKTAKGYFLAGSGLSGTFIAGSMLLTNLSAENLVGLSGQSYAANMSGMAWEATAVIATIVMAFVFLPLYLKKGYTTLPEFMEERYGVGVRRLVSILFLLGYLVVGIPVCLYAGAIAFNQIFDLGAVFGISDGMALTILIVLVGIIGALYAVLGGMRAVAVSDTINGILLVIGSLMVVVFGFIAVGKLNGGGFLAGIQDVVNFNPEKLNAIGGKTDPVPFACIFTGMLLANLFYWGTNQVLIQRALGAASLKRRTERCSDFRFPENDGSAASVFSRCNCSKTGSGSGKQRLCISDSGCKVSALAGGRTFLCGIIRLHYFHI